MEAKKNIVSPLIHLENKHYIKKRERDEFENAFDKKELYGVFVLEDNKIIDMLNNLALKCEVLSISLRLNCLFSS